MNDGQVNNFCSVSPALILDVYKKYLKVMQNILKL